MLRKQKKITLTKNEDLRTVERKILRTIFDPIWIAENEYRGRINHELLLGIKWGDVLTKIKTIKGENGKIMYGAK